MDALRLQASFEMRPTLVSLFSWLAGSASAKIIYAGIAESGGEFGVYSATATPGTGLPGRFGVDYAFINKSTVDVFVSSDKVCASHMSRPLGDCLCIPCVKVNLFRVAFLMVGHGARLPVSPLIDLPL